MRQGSTFHRETLDHTPFHHWHPHNLCHHHMSVPYRYSDPNHIRINLRSANYTAEQFISRYISKTLNKNEDQLGKNSDVISKNNT